jgi:hypothetical protein
MCHNRQGAYLQIKMNPSGVSSSQSESQTQMESKPRVINVDIHVLAYLGDYLKAFKALVRGKVKSVASSPRKIG